MMGRRNPSCWRLFLLICFAEAATGLMQHPTRIIVDISSSSAEEQDQLVLAWLTTNRSWAWGISADPFVTVDDLKKVRSLGLVPVATYLDASPDTRARHAQRKNWTDDQDYTPAAVFAKQIEAAGGDPSDVVWMGFTEEDSSGYGFAHVLMNATQPSNSCHDDAQELFDNYVATAMTSEDGAAPWVAEGVVVLGRNGFSSAPHTMARHGVDWIMTERANDDVGDLQPGIAFLRGAARQYAPPRNAPLPMSKPWGVDMSMWWGAVAGWCVDQPPSFYRRHLYHSFFAGASLLEIEGADTLLDSTTGEPMPLALELDTFGKFTAAFSSENDDETWAVDAPVALVLPVEQGWTDSPPYWAPTAASTTSWNFARLAMRRPGDRGVDGIFALLFPGADLAAQPWPWGKCESHVTWNWNFPFRIFCNSLSLSLSLSP